MKKFIGSNLCLLMFVFASPAIGEVLPDYFQLRHLDMTGRTIVAKQDVVIPGNGTIIYAKYGRISNVEQGGDHCSFQGEPEDFSGIHRILSERSYTVLSYSSGTDRKNFTVADDNCRWRRGRRSCTRLETWGRDLIHVIVEDSIGNKFDIDCMTGYSRFENQQYVTPVTLNAHLAPFFDIEELISE